MNPTIKVKKNQDYYDKNDVVIETSVEVTKPVEVVTTSLTVGEIKQKIADLKQAKIDKVAAIQKQIDDLQALLDSTKDEVDAVKIKAIKKQPAEGSNQVLQNK